MLAHANPDADRPLDPFKAAMASRDSDILTFVHDALAAGRTKMAYQPIMLASEKSGVAFYEGLVRVLDEAGRVLPAAHFMSVIGENDLGREIDCAALKHAFKLLRNRKDLRISINISARSLADGKWRDILARGLADTSDVGNRLIFEISETSAMELHEIMIRFMVEMQPKGVAFALDGFGAGMTAFRHLKEFFFDLVKIDKSFVRGIQNDPDNQVIIEALMMVAHQFEMFVVADGVETAQEAAFMSDLGADCLQGYHFGVPKFDI